MFPKLVGDAKLSDEELADILNDLGEELRHIQYHIGDLRYFDYLR
ncbi:hypothetical protein U91I_02764 [alpha proteobacterium U9-1i]|nr:hypothetical protein U91I_02764 [alpha proteobacterium U9-1i]